MNEKRRPPLEMSDLEIIRKCLSGESELFSLLVTRYKKLVFSVISNFGINGPDAGDLSQEVFIRAFTSLDRYRPEYRLSTWLIRISTTMCIDWLRRRKQEALPMEQVTDGRWDPEASFIKNENIMMMRKAISELPEKYRVPVVLFHLEHVPYRDLQQVLNQPESVIKNRLYRARIMLREKLRARWEEQ